MRTFVESSRIDPSQTSKEQKPWPSTVDMQSTVIEVPDVAVIRPVIDAETRAAMKEVSDALLHPIVEEGRTSLDELINPTLVEILIQPEPGSPKIGEPQA